MEILHYAINLESLFNEQDKQNSINDAKEADYKRQGEENKKVLLKAVLPLMHGIYALHNRKCELNSCFSTGRYGLLGPSKVDIDENLDFIVNSQSNLFWEENFSVFSFSAGTIKGFKVWLNAPQPGKHPMVINRNESYSMTSVIKSGNDTYGGTVEEELLKVAQYCARFKDEW